MATLFRFGPVLYGRAVVVASDSGSQFVEVDIPIDNASTEAFNNTVHRSAVLPAQNAMVTDMPESLYQDWHPASPTPASFRTFRHTRSRNQRREEAPMQQRQRVPCRRCRHQWPSHPHDRRPGPCVVRASASRSQSRLPIAAIRAEFTDLPALGQQPKLARRRAGTRVPARQIKTRYPANAAISSRASVSASSRAIPASAVSMLASDRG
jgi:hypothetical protein